MPKFQIFSVKSTMMVKAFRHLRKFKMIVKVFNCIRGSDSRVYYKKIVLNKFKNFTEKNLCMSLFLNKVTGLHPEFFFKKKAHVFSCKLCQIF